ncbi:acid protease [Macrolepiota fuliginosa MF-IS2]|uniref:Acid protease n=1 Tax=Macrolepiota fuliginosa MF-IS2 TaxID=1400762 RepID=A0A9P5XCM1_9AGAR|nr:acid protease [Macrolepiota fuliginosa MF-IS2]
MPSWKGKGKANPPAVRADDDNAGSAGVVVPLGLVGGGVYDAQVLFYSVYTAPVSIGRNAQTFSLQVDTGSSDLWVASTSCSSSPCGQTGGHNYDPSASALQTGSQFSIQYLSGQVSGPIVWDRVNVGGYSIENQALAAAASVTNETLSSDFIGILGLALPLNSIIAENIPPVTTNAPDGAAWASNLFSITPVENAPASRFISLSLSRPGSDRIPALLGIGKHPPEVVKDPSLVRYSAVVSNPTGSLFWKAGVRAITVYVNGQPRPVDIGRSNTGGVFPSAVIDSGVPYIFTTSKVANAIYGAIDVHPAQDGNYYVPCSTPLNVSITLDDRPELSLHPLDLTAEPPKDNNADFCIGLIQAADAQLTRPTSGIGDMILGVPFMRNVYTVMAYTIPNSDGSFPPVNSSDPDAGIQPVRPRLGLMSLTDPTTALSEFNTVRVLKEPLSTDGQSDPSSSHSPTSGKKLSVGIIVLISLLGFFALCCSLFLIRWLVYRRRFDKEREKERKEELTDDKRALAYQLARRGSGDFTGMPSEDTLRVMRYEAYTKKEQAMSHSSRSQNPSDHVDEFGVRDEGWNEDTLVAGARNAPSLKSSPSRHSRSSSSPERLHRHQRTPSEMPDAHQRTTSIATPLLESSYPVHHNDDYPPYPDDIHRRED